MTFGPDSANPLAALAISTLTFLCMAKLWRECGVHALRKRLRVLDAELFEFARRGHLGTGDPAYAMLRDSIKSIAQSASEISLTRLLATAALDWRSGGLRAAEAHRNDWEAALESVSSGEVQARIAALRERFLLEVGRFMLLGPVPAVAAFPDTAPLRAACERSRLLLLHGASVVEARALSLPAA